jgi:hypothetical protein
MRLETDSSVVIRKIFSRDLFLWLICNRLTEWKSIERERERDDDHHHHQLAERAVVKGSDDFVLWVSLFFTLSLLNLV